MKRQFLQSQRQKMLVALVAFLGVQGIAFNQTNVLAEDTYSYAEAEHAPVQEVVSVPLEQRLSRTELVRLRILANRDELSQQTLNQVLLINAGGLLQSGVLVNVKVLGYEVEVAPIDLINAVFVLLRSEGPTNIDLFNATLLNLY